MHNAECRIKLLLRYIQTLKNYSKTPKGKHDLFDYTKAVALILSTTIIIILILHS